MTLYHDNLCSFLSTWNCMPDQLNTLNFRTMPMTTVHLLSAVSKVLLPKALKIIGDYLTFNNETSDVFC